MNKVAIVSLLALLTLTGCNKADHALALATSGTVRTIAAIAGSGSPAAAARSVARSYRNNPVKAVQAARSVKYATGHLFALLDVNVGRQWGSDARMPSRTRYVKYTQNYKSRAIVDFDKGVVTVETVDDAAPAQSLKNAIVTTLLTPNDPRAVDLFSDRSITLTSDKEPYLLGLVEDRQGRSIDSPKRAEAFADFLLSSRMQQRQVKLKGGEKQASFVSINMVSNFSHAQAEKYRPMVERYAAKYDVSPSLVFAVIRTESNFNPFAVSPAPAYGLMQLVPSSGGREAYQVVKGRKATPSKRYLLNAENNIELGTAYLGLLSHRQLRWIENRTSREYCVISAYNTGTRNVFKAFARGGDRTAAVNRINSVEPPAVYRQLRQKLPYKETRRYLYKVVKFRKNYVVL
jgi:membrane-bound lytic murein transglycosylase C